MTDVLRAHQVPGVRHRASFIICYGPLCAILQPWNGTSAVNIHSSVTKSALCLLLAAGVSVSPPLILFPAASESTVLLIGGEPQDL